MTSRCLTLSYRSHFWPSPPLPLGSPSEDELLIVPEWCSWLAKVKFVQCVGCMDLDVDFCFSFTDKCPWDPEEALDAEASRSEDSERTSEGASRAGSTQDRPEPGDCSDNAEVSRRLNSHIAKAMPPVLRLADASARCPDPAQTLPRLLPPVQPASSVSVRAAPIAPAHAKESRTGVITEGGYRKNQPRPQTQG